MAHFWCRGSNEDWVVHSLQSEAYALSRDPESPVQAIEKGNGAPAPVVRRYAGDRNEWLLIAGPNPSRVNVDGLPLQLGIRVLRDRDEVRVGNLRMFYSAETLARIVPFSKTDAKKPLCPRCRQPIVEQTPAVRCPQCGVWYHQSEDLPCWTYSEECALCDQPTELEAGYRWTPENL